MRRSAALSLTRSAFLPPRSMTKKLTVPKETTVGFTPLPKASGAVSTARPFTRASASGASATATPPSAARVTLPRWAGPLASTMALSPALPTVLSPGWRKCSPIKVSQPSGVVSRFNRSARAASTD